VHALPASSPEIAADQFADLSQILAVHKRYFAEDVEEIQHCAQGRRFGQVAS
jgi:hypothetical protein